MDELVISDCIRFTWDLGNRDKNWDKHGISTLECEQVFFNDPLLIYEDIKHSQAETRMYALGQTDNYKKLFIAFTIRDRHIRVISARKMSKRERGLYEKT